MGVSMYIFSLCNYYSFNYKERKKKISNPVDLNPSRPDPGQREKINLNFYFYTSLWCLKMFYEGLKGLHKSF